MRYRQLPGTDVELSVISFGPMRLGTGAGSVADGGRALHAAMDAGITTLHSSAEYGPYDAFTASLERHPARTSVQHVIKVQTPEYGENTFDAEAFEAQIDRALLALGAERIAVVQHLQRGPASAMNAYDEHGDALRLPRFDAVHGPLFEVAERLKAKGKIGALVGFPHTMPFARRAVREEGFDGFAHFFGVLEPEFVELFDELTSRGRGFIAIRPLLQGMLTDQRIERHLLPADDPKRQATWDPWYEAADAVRDTLGERPASWTRFALRFSITPSAVTTSVVGINTPAQLEEVLVAVEEGPLEPALVAQVAKVVAARPPIAKATLF